MRATPQLWGPLQIGFLFFFLLPGSLEWIVVSALWEAGQTALVGREVRAGLVVVGFELFLFVFSTDLFPERLKTKQLFGLPFEP